MWSTPVTMPPISVVLPPGSGGGSRMGSWPSVVSPEEVAELSNISVLGCCGSLGAGLVVNADFCCEAGVFGAPDAACGSDEFDCGHAKAADTNNRATITN